MAGWSILTNGFAFDCGKINSCQSNVLLPEIDHGVKDNSFCCSEDYEDKVKCLFDQVLSAFLKEVAGRGCIRPVPVMLGDGQSLDLFKLFRVVRERGGFHMVSENGLWAFVLKELGLDPSVLASVKLIYAKYLGELEKWLMGSSKGLEDGGCDCGGNFSLLSIDLESEFRSLLVNWPSKTIKDDRLTLAEYRSELDLWDTNRRHARYNVVRKSSDDDDEKIHDNDYSVVRKELFFRKRKRESLSGILNWVIQIAKHPDDPSIGAIPEPSKWKERGDKEVWLQAIRARDALLQRRHVDSNKHSFLQNSCKMHPSMYDDLTCLSHHSTERLRCSERLPTLVKSRLCSCCNSCYATEGKLTSPRKTQLENGSKEETAMTTLSSSLNTMLGTYWDEPYEKHVSVGPLFQADVPEWTGVVSESDSKWLGTRVWPLVDGEHNSLNERELIGSGRPDSCSCQLPGSVQCVRFHIAENRMKLKLELGSVFYCWRFDRMGEEVSLRWTIEEEKRFKDMVRFNPPSLSERFWDNASKCFRKKTREDLVSYYFNVFLVCRRSYQNRVTPKNIDSDDDESEVGFIGGSFGHEAVKVPGSDILICTQNNQFTFLE